MSGDVAAQPAAAVPEVSARAVRLAAPYRGIEEFRFVDAPIFFGRDDEARSLLRLIIVYRGVLLYGDSGVGKSSLINAKLLPNAVKEGFAPERIRVQPKPGHELIVERIATRDDDNDAPPLPTIFDTDPSYRRTSVSVAAFKSRLYEKCLPRIVEGRSVMPPVYPLLVFDQFEELVTLTEQAVREARARKQDDQVKAILEARDSITSTLIELLQHETLGAKLLFVFREDYYAKLSKFFACHPRLKDQYLRVEPLHVEELPDIVNGPFTAKDVTFDRELPQPVRDALMAELHEGKSDLLNLTEVQIAGVKLCSASDPAALLASLHYNGLIESYFTDAVSAVPRSLRDAAMVLLDRMVTSSGTRNVVSSETLLLAAKEKKIAPKIAQEALKALEETAHVVRREERNEVVIYEIVSEFLVPWIMRHKEYALAAERELRWVRGFWLSVGILVLVLLGMGTYVYRQSASRLQVQVKDLTEKLKTTTKANVELNAELGEARVVAKNLKDSQVRIAQLEKQLALAQASAQKASTDVALQRARADQAERTVARVKDDLARAQNQQQLLWSTTGVVEERDQARSDLERTRRELAAAQALIRKLQKQLKSH